MCLITTADHEKDTMILVQALTQLSKEKSSSKNEEIKSIPVHVPDIPVLALSPRDAFYANTESVPFEESAGRIIAEFVMVYPPGIPIFIPGEIITQENLDYIKENLEAGLPVQGPEDAELKYLKVIQEQVAIR